MKALSLDQFGSLLRGLIPAVEDAAQGAFEAGARTIAEDARIRLGTYQGAEGPFSAWRELADDTKRERVEQGWTENDPLLRSGELRAAITSEVRRSEGVVGVPSMTVGDGTPANPARDIGDIALDMEFGTRIVPERPFLGPAAYVQGPHIAKDIGIAAGAALAGERATRRRPSPDDIPF